MDHPGFGLHLDAKAMIGAQENYAAVFNAYGSQMSHFHVGDPGLAPPGHTGVDHAVIGEALAASAYNGFVSIEMKRGFGDSRDVVTKAVSYVRKKYHMGAAEYEWGVVPETLNKIAKNIKNYVPKKIEEYRKKVATEREVWNNLRHKE